jgi:hypothetical protein
VFYSGTKAVEEDFELSLSDAFICKGKEADLELKVRVINMIPGSKGHALTACSQMHDFGTRKIMRK